MLMTDEQRYSAVLKELGEVLQDKNTTISCQKWQIDQLKEKLAAAEKERDEMCESMGYNETALGDGENYYLLGREAIARLRVINAQLLNVLVQENVHIPELESLQQVLAEILPIKGGAA